MKRFVTLLTVSITMAAIAFADHPSMDPEYGEGTNFPFHPGPWVTTSYDAGNIWQECFCLPTASYEVQTNDPTVPIRVFNTMRLTGGITDECQTTGIYNPEPKNWYSPGTTNSFSLDFYFAGQPLSSVEEGLGFFITDDIAVTPERAMLNLAVTMQNLGGAIQVSVVDASGPKLTVPIPGNTPDYRFYLMRIEYTYVEAADQGLLSLRVFDFASDPTGAVIELVNDLPIIPVNSGYLAFSAHACPVEGVVPYQYIDDICMSFGYTPTAEAVVAESSFELGQNFPNPFNPTTTISYTAKETGELSLKVYDLAGSLVSTLVDGMVEMGEHEVVFNGSNLASGVYFYTIESAGMVSTKKMVLVK